MISIREYLGDLVGKMPKIVASQEDLDTLITKVDNILLKIGNVSDFGEDHTLLGYHNDLYQYFGNESKVYPTLADAIIAYTGVATWQLGAFVEIIPSGIITSTYSIRNAILEGSSAIDVYEIVLYRGLIGNEVEIGRIRSIRDKTRTGMSTLPFQTCKLEANERVSIKVASKGDGADAVSISLNYITYH